MLRRFPLFRHVARFADGTFVSAGADAFSHLHTAL